MRRELIEKRLKANPEMSDRAIAKEAKANGKTVAAVRSKLEATAEIPQLDKRVGGDGKARAMPAEKPKFVPTPTRPNYSAVARVAQKVLEDQGISVPGLSTETQQAPRLHTEEPQQDNGVKPAEHEAVEPVEQPQPVEHIHPVEHVHPVELPRPVEPTSAAETEPSVNRVEQIKALIRELPTDEFEQLMRWLGYGEAAPVAEEPIQVVKEPEAPKQQPEPDQERVVEPEEVDEPAEVVPEATEPVVTGDQTANLQFERPTQAGPEPEHPEPEGSLSDLDRETLRIFRECAAAGGPPWIGVARRDQLDIDEDAVDRLVAGGHLVQCPANPHAFGVPQPEVAAAA